MFFLGCKSTKKNLITKQFDKKNIVEVKKMV
jgi:hypothetical protein